MPSIAHELFLLTTNLSQLKSKELIIKLFVESVNSIFLNHEFVWLPEVGSLSGTSIVVCTRQKTFGCIGFAKHPKLTDEEYVLLQNACQLLAIMLEKLEQEMLLNDQKMHLNHLVDEKTMNLLQSQAELEEQKEEINAKNEELSKFNIELQLAKEKAEESERTIKEQSQEIENFFTSAIDLLCIANTEGYFIRLNKEWENTLGYSLQELENKKFLDLVHPDDMQATLNALVQLDKQIKLVDFINRFLCKDGSYRWIEWKSYPHGNKIYAAARDITQRKRIEEELIKAKELTEESETLLRNITDNTPAYVAAVDINTLKYVFVNQKFEKSFNKTHDEIIGTHISKIIGEANYEFAKEYIEIVRQGKQASYVNIFDIAEGKRYINVNYVPGYDINGNLNKIIVLSIDVSELKQKEEELIKAKEKAEESDRLKTAFLQNMSHEIRTPMNAIMGFSELLIKNFGNKQKLENFASIINQRCTDLLDIINDILDIAKIESGQLTVNVESCAIADLFAELKDMFVVYQNRLNKQHISFSFNVDKELFNTVIFTDIVKLKQVFINLISNAFKFTNSGRIEIGCKLDLNKNIIFFVSDTGMGIPQDKFQYIFQRFSQVDKGNSRLFGGTGLGLSIVKGLVELLGGSVWLESEVDKGTCFFFTIIYIDLVKTEVAHNIRSLAEEVVMHDNKTILIVEDDKYNMTLIEEMLSGLGLNILCAENGKQAIQMSLFHHPDIILMDIGLPDINGYEVIKQVLTQEPTLKIIAQTAYATADDRYNVMQSGCVDYISKPLKSQKLLEMVSKYI